MTRHLGTLVQTVEARPWVTERYLRRLVAERRIPFHKAGGKVLIDLDDLDAYAEAGRVEPPTPARLGHQRPRSVRNGNADPFPEAGATTTIAPLQGRRHENTTAPPRS